jgi:hypothetical protein
MPVNDNTRDSNRVNSNMQRNAPAYAASSRATRLPMHFNPREMRSGQKKTSARPV